MRSAFLGMPGYGQIEIGASRGLWRASKGTHAGLDLTVQYASSSSLTQNFNALWCLALNAAHEGRPYDYFAMLHSDVEPEDFWLDKLIAELEDRKLDVLSVVVPIKDQNGLTSTALARPDDSWRPLCRLTMREVMQLPVTFTAEDVGHPLLLNTGCWVCKFDFKWAQNIAFDINNRICFSTVKKSYFAQFEPEDWYFSRLCHELNLKIGATRTIAVQHAGSMRFANTHVWGTKAFDAEYVPESIIPLASDASKDGFKFPRDVHGWLLHDEGKALWNLAKGKRVLEIGSYCGKSTICLAQSAESVTSIDPHDGRATPELRSTLDHFTKNIQRYGVADKVNSFVGTTNDIAPGLVDSGEKFDLIFIDGNHDKEAVKNDYNWALQLLEPGGIVAFHDYRSHFGEHDQGWDPGVTSCVDEILANGADLLARHRTVAVVQPALVAN